MQPEIQIFTPYINFQSSPTVVGEPKAVLSALMLYWSINKVNTKTYLQKPKVVLRGSSDRLSNLFRNIRGLACLIRPPLPQLVTTPPATRHDVKMQVRHDLAGNPAIVHAEIETLNLRAFLHGGGYFFYDLEQIAKNGSRRVQNVRIMFFRDDQCMSGIDGVDVQKREKRFVLIDFIGRNFPLNDFTKYTIRHICSSQN